MLPTCTDGDRSPRQECRKGETAMIILHESLNLDPASPASVDGLCALAQEELAPAAERLGARLIGAFTCDADWFAQAQHLFEFDDLAAYDSFRARAAADEQWQRCSAMLEDLAPQQASQLLEPLGAIPVESLHAAIKASETKPVEIYSMATLEVLPRAMPSFIKLLSGGAGALPIAASWRPVVGNRLMVMDLWTTALGRDPYRPAQDGMRTFFNSLRDVAPKERLVNWAALPYSPLR
jgi:hypothetical protein